MSVTIDSAETNLEAGSLVAEATARLWDESQDWRQTVEQIVDQTLNRVAALELCKALADHPVGGRVR